MASRWALALALATACDARQDATPGEQTTSAESDEPDEDQTATTSDGGPSPEVDESQGVQADPPQARSDTAEPKPPAPPDLPPPLQSRRALKAMMLYAEPSFTAPFRGKLGRRDVFAVYSSPQPDEQCKVGWAQVAVAGYGCLDDTEVTSKKPKPLPQLLRGEVTPFYWARLKKKPSADAENPPAPLWRSRRALRSGAEPIGALEPAHDYAFTRRRRGRGGPFLSDATHRTVREKDVKRHKPSRFAGRDLLADPVPEGKRLTWSVQWPSAVRRDEPRTDAEPRRGIEYHEIFFTRAGPDAEQEHRGTTFVEIADEDAWVEAKEIRRYLPAEPLADVEAGEIWLDVDLDQQALTIWRGETPEFVTLVSSGNWKNPTPRGIYRIITKQAYGDMRSRPDEEDTYWVESVPWVMYFDGRYAFHGTFWHNRFGRRTSHGCINLSPLDAARVFDAIAPELPPGWMIAYEHQEVPGTTVRIRNGDEDVPDRRGDPLERTVDQYQ